MRESKSLLKLGHTVALVARHSRSSKVPEGIELLPVSDRQRTRWERIKLMRRVYQLARNWPADVYHAHEPESLAVGILLKWRTGAKLVFDSHECFHYTAAAFMHGWKARLAISLTSRLFKWMSRRANHVIVVSFTSERFYREYCGCREVTLLHNSPPPDLFPCKDKPPEAAHTITHHGLLGVRRGQNQLLEAVALIKRQRPVRLLIVGKIVDSDHASFEQRVRELGLKNEVEVTGWLPYEQNGPALNRGSIGVVGMQQTRNSYASLSNKLFHYMCTGQAVIGPVGSDSEQVIREADCGLAVDMTNPKELADAILSLMDDPQRCRRYGENARRAIELKFGWHKMEEALRKTYEDLRDRTPQPESR